MQSSHGKQAANELQAVRAKIEQLEGKVADVEKQANLADPALKVALLQQLPGLQQQLAGLQQQLATLLAKEERLAAAEAVAAAAARSGPGRAAEKFDYNSLEVQRDLRWLTEHYSQVYSSLKPHSAGDQFISFNGKTLHVVIPPELYSSVYVRPLYWNLLDLLEKADKHDGSIVTGNPGVGKSAFATLLIAFLAHSKRPVMYHHKTSKRETLLLMDYSKQPFECKMAAYDVDVHTKWQVDHPGLWLIWDGNAPEGQHDTSLREVVLTSPKEGTWNEFRKKTSGAPLWLDTWSLKELKACATLSNERQDFLGTNAVSQRFREVGGIARYVLQQPDATAEAAVQKFDPHDVAALLNVQSLGSDTTVSHRLLHARADANCKFLYYQVASPEILKLLTQKIRTFAGDSLLDFIRRSAGDPRFSVLRGLMFEQHGHLALQAGAGVWMRQLAPAVKRRADEMDEDEAEAEGEDAAGEQDDMDLPGPASHHYEAVCDDVSSNGSVVQSLQHGAEHDWGNIRGAKLVQLLQVQHMWDNPDLDPSSIDEAYVQPPTTNNPSLDAFYKHRVCGQVLMLQFTVSRHHATRAAPVVRFLQRLTSPEDRRQAKMVFVIPGDDMQQFKDFKHQSWLGRSGKVLSRLPKDLQDVQQWVMALPLRASRPNSAASGV